MTDSVTVEYGEAVRSEGDLYHPASMTLAPSRSPILHDICRACLQEQAARR